MVAEASEVIERALEQPSADVQSLDVVFGYYIMCKSDRQIADEIGVVRSRVAQRRKRGLAKLEPFVPR